MIELKSLKKHRVHLIVKPLELSPVVLISQRTSSQPSSERDGIPVYMGVELTHQQRSLTLWRALNIGVQAAELAADLDVDEPGQAPSSVASERGRMRKSRGHMRETRDP